MQEPYYLANFQCVVQDVAALENGKAQVQAPFFPAQS